MPSTPTLVLLFAVVLGAVLYLVDQFTYLKGIAPILHAGTPYAFVSSMPTMTRSDRPLAREWNEG